jgi:hypothetical protein
MEDTDRIIRRARSKMSEKKAILSLQLYTLKFLYLNPK